MQLIKKIRNVLVLNAILYLILGIIMFIFPTMINNIICYLLGFLALVFGISMIVNYFNQGYTTFAKVVLIVGLIATFLGIYIFLNPEKFSSLIPLMAGVLIIVESIDKYKHSFELKKQGYDKWWITMISATILFSLALFLILYPFESIKLTIRVIGLILLVDSISDMCTIFSYSRITKNIIKK